MILPKLSWFKNNSENSDRGEWVFWSYGLVESVGEIGSCPPLGEGYPQ